MFVRNQKAITVSRNCKDASQYGNETLTLFCEVSQKFFFSAKLSVPLLKAHLMPACFLFCSRCEKYPFLLNSSKFMEHALNTVYLFH